MSHNLLAQDEKYVWHPFTQHQHSLKPLEIERAQGAYLYTKDGRNIFDAISSWWVTLHGHCHPYLTKKIHEQLKHLDHVIFAGATHQPAVTLAKRLTAMTPGKMAKVFYSDNGSTAVEVGLKLALQYWFNQGVTKERIIAFRHSYHGDTFGAMSVGERSTFNRPFWDKLFHVDFIDPPLRGQEKQSLEQLKKILSNSNDVACFIFEPMVQGAGGMLMQEPLALNELIAYARSKGVICIADEVMTGFGRTGKFFALDHIEENSDILCVAKGLTGGVVPLSATLCTEHIYESFLSQDKTKAFFHGHSFTANPVGCAASLASMDLLTEPNTMHSIESIASHHQRFCTELSSSPLNRHIKDVRSLGTICALELNTKARGGYFNELADHMKIFFYDQDVLLRPLGNVVYILPPYCSSENELNMAYQVIWNFLECLD